MNTSISEMYDAINNAQNWAELEELRPTILNMGNRTLHEAYIQRKQRLWVVGHAGRAPYRFIDVERMLAAIQTVALAGLKAGLPFEVETLRKLARTLPVSDLLGHSTAWQAVAAFKARTRADKVDGIMAAELALTVFKPEPGMPTWLSSWMSDFVETATAYCNAPEGQDDLQLAAYMDVCIPVLRACYGE